MAIMNWDELKKRLNLNTGFFETSNYTLDTQMRVTSGNHDGAGMSGGNLQYNFGAADRLQELFLFMLNNHDAVVQAAFGTNTTQYNEFNTVIRTYTRADRITWADGITDYSDGEGRALIEPWSSIFADLLTRPETIDKYLAMQDVYYVPAALDLFKQLDCDSRASLASIFDLNINRGRFYPCNTLVVDFERINADDVNYPTSVEKEAEKIRMINVRGNDTTNAMGEGAQWFVQRRECQGNQGGTYYGNVYDPENDFDITQDVAIVEKADTLGVNLGSMSVENLYLGVTPIKSLYLGATLLGGKAEPYTTATAPQTQFRTNDNNYLGIGDVTSVTLESGQPLWVDVQNWIAAKTYYTTDGTTPTVESNLYHEQLTFTESVTLKTLTVSTSGVAEAVKTLNVNIAASGANWRYLKITPDTMNGHWQCAEIEIIDSGATNRALAATGSLNPAADGANTFGTWAALQNGDTATNGVYWTWGYPLEIQVDLGANYDLTQMDIYLGSSTTNPSTGATVLVSANNVDWVEGKVTQQTNPSTLLQRYTITA